jgi:VWFA-related protein
MAVASAQTGLPQFRARTDAVTVNVSVRRGNRPVAGLGPSDFTLLDDGAPQTVEVANVGDVPLDVTCVYGVGLFSNENVARFRNDVGRIAQLLRSFDRLRVLEYATRVREVLPLQTPDAQSVTAQLEQFRTHASSPTGGWTALYDALVAALVLPTSPDRRQLVMAFYESSDTFSITSPSRLQTVAERTEAVLHVQWFRPSNGRTVRQAFGSFPFYLSGVQTRAPDLIAKIAEATGGEMRGSSILGRSIVDLFRDVSTEYRQSYVLQYTPTNTPHPGWHELSVKINRPGKYEVLARRGYFIDTP